MLSTLSDAVPFPSFYNSRECVAQRQCGGAIHWMSPLRLPVYTAYNGPGRVSRSSRCVTDDTKAAYLLRRRGHGTL